MDSGSAKNRLVLVVLVSKHQTTWSTDQVFQFFQSNNIFEAISIEKKEWIADSADVTACRFELISSKDEDTLREELKAVYNSNNLDQFSDFILCSSAQYFTPKKLVVFDMDGTLLDNECIDEIAGEVGIMQEVSRITKMAMESSISSNEMHTKIWRHGLWRVTQAKSSLTGWIRRTSTGKCVEETQIAQRNLQTHESTQESRLEIADGKLTGKVIPPIVDGKIKEFVVGCLSEKEHFDIAETVAIGDGSNDKLMIHRSGFGVAFHAKAILKNATKHHLNVCSMDSLACYLNVDLAEFAKDDLEVAENFVEWKNTKNFAPLHDFMKDPPLSNQ